MTTEEMILKEGYDKGLEQGLEQGRQSMLLMQLKERFGPLPGALEERVRAATPDQLEAWSRAVLRAPTLADVFAV
jgi:hypothetical protein